MKLEEALERIKVLEEEKKELLAQIEVLKKQKAGRKKHDAAWTASYQDFVVNYEKGMSIAEIVELGSISRRTAYRYRTYYQEMQKLQGEVVK